MCSKQVSWAHPFCSQNNAPTPSECSVCDDGARIRGLEIIMEDTDHPESPDWSERYEATSLRRTMTPQTSSDRSMSIRDIVSRAYAGITQEDCPRFLLTLNGRPLPWSRNNFDSGDLRD